MQSFILRPFGRFSIFAALFVELPSANILVALVGVITPHVIEFVRSNGLVRAIFYDVGEKPQQVRFPCNQVQFKKNDESQMN
jgi:hypothetical protein